MPAEPNSVVLLDRGAVRVAGADAFKLLQGLITNDMARLDHQPALHAALLQPQGKILFDFFVLRYREGYLLEVARDRAAELAKRLSFYKLRADVAIEDVSQSVTVQAVFEPIAEPSGRAPEAVAFPDPRLPELGWRIVGSAEDSRNGNELAAASPYHAHRIALGVPEGGKDYAFGDTFPHEADMDVLNGVDFEKGCFIGQEVVSRMQHRAAVRKRVVPVIGREALPETGTEVLAGEVPIGKLGSVAAQRGLALIRLDRAAETLNKGGRLYVGGIEIELEKPAWASFAVPVRGA